MCADEEAIEEASSQSVVNSPNNESSPALFRLRAGSPVSDILLADAAADDDDDDDEDEEGDGRFLCSVFPFLFCCCCCCCWACLRWVSGFGGGARPLPILSRSQAFPARATGT